MGKGKRAHGSNVLRALIVVIATSAVVMPVQALAADTASDSLRAAPQSSPQGSNPAASGVLVWLKSAGSVKVVSTQSSHNSVNGAIRGLGKVSRAHSSRRQASILQRFAQGDGRERWYAMAGAGSSAVALLPGAVIEAEGLRLQRRARIGNVQLGLARDIGDSRVTLGYLRNINQRDRLIPYYTRKTRQNLAALTLTFKH